MIYLSWEVLVNAASIFLVVASVIAFGLFLYGIRPCVSVKSFRALCAVWVGGIVGVLVDLDHIWGAVSHGFEWYNIIAWITVGGRSLHTPALIVSGGILLCLSTCFCGFLLVNLYKKQ